MARQVIEKPFILSLADPILRDLFH
jgi:hypothetical protein